ncbi:phage holin family protein [Aeromicrobium sp. CF4.19]|uniref:phage holin family protein n=1 Tax=Aeromicrobium sp. CF4.19 TaxID=3373082 RepID=UPI003EE48CE5
MSQQHDDPTIGRIVADITRDLNTIVQYQVDLAKTELKTSAKAGGIGLAMFVVAAFLGLIVIIFVSISLAFLVSMTGLHLAWSFLIIAGLYVLLAGVLLLVGYRLLRKVRAPRKSLETAKQIPPALRGHAPSERLDARN